MTGCRHPMTTTLAIILSILGVYQLAEASLPKGQRLRHRTPDNGSHPQPVVRRLQPEHRRAQKKRGQGGADGQYTVQEEEYFAYCREELTSDGVTADGIISQNEFADKLVDFCGHFMVDNIAGHRCPLNRFSSLDVDLQLVFVFALCPEDDPEDQRVACVNSLRSLDDAGIEFGYIVSPETMTEVAEDVEHLCSGLFSFVFPDDEISDSTAPVEDAASPAADAPTASPNKALPDPVVPETPADDNGQGSGQGNGQDDVQDSVQGDVQDGEQGKGQDIEQGDGQPTIEGNNEGETSGIDNADSGGGDADNTDAAEQQGREFLGGNDDNDLVAGRILGIVVAAAVFLLCCIALFGRRRRAEEEDGKPLEDVGEGSQGTEGTPDLQFANLDAMADTGDAGSDTWSPLGQKRSVVQFDPTSGVAHRVDDSSHRSSRASGVGAPEMEQVFSAIDAGNWDEVYTLASQLAEREDASTMSSTGKQSARRIAAGVTRTPRQGLSDEDRARTSTLDELAENGDWTGLAVTAALYAGESTASRNTSAPARRSILDIMTGKPASSRAAANASVEDILRPTGSAQTDDTKSSSIGNSNLLAALSFESEDDPPTRSGKTQNTAWQAKSLGFGIFGSSQPTTPDRVGSTGTGGSGMSARLGSLKSDIDKAVDAGDWDKVLLLSSQVEADQSFRDNMAQLASTARPSAPSPAQGGVSLEEQLDRAIYHGDWAMVTHFANRIIEERGGDPQGGGMAMSDSRALVPASRTVGLGSVDTSDTLADKRQTIEKLARAKSYKGVSIMAGLYSLESGQAQDPPGATSSDVTTSESTSGPSWMGLFGSPPATTTPTADPNQSSWMGILNLASSTDDTPYQQRAQQVQPSPPTLVGREEVQLRSAIPQLTTASPLSEEAGGSTGRSLIPIAELRPTGGATHQPTPRPPQSTSSLHGAKQLIPYWQDKERQASQDEDDLADRRPGGM